MKIFEIITKQNKKVEIPPPRNFVAKNAKTSGAGPHTSKKFSRKEKHRKDPQST